MGSRRIPRSSQQTCSRCTRAIFSRGRLGCRIVHSDRFGPLIAADPDQVCCPLGATHIILVPYDSWLAMARQSRRGGMADAEDLKSSGRERPCGFDSHRRYWTWDDFVGRTRRAIWRHRPRDIGLTLVDSISCSVATTDGRTLVRAANREFCRSTASHGRPNPICSMGR